MMDKAKMRLAFPGLRSLALAALLGAVWPMQAETAHSKAPAVTVTEQDAPQAQSISGTIDSVGRNTFTLTIGPSAANPVGSQMQQTTAKSMTFMIDQNTTVEGKLKVGANADVTYRQDNGNNVAISVRVSTVS
jgi:hypothetical protein